MDAFFRKVLGEAHCFATAPKPPPLDSAHCLSEMGIAGEKASELEGRCNAGSSKACLAAGLMAMEGQGGAKQDLGRAAGLFAEACEKGEAKACFFLARMFEGMHAMDASHFARDDAKAGKYYRNACSGQVGEACFNYGQMLDQGRVPGEDGGKRLHRRVAKYEGTEIAKDHNGALILFKRGCELGDGVACGHAGSMTANGEGLKGGADKSAAAELLYEGCRLGHARSCIAQAKMLSAAAAEALEKESATGEHMLQAKARAVMFYRRACELGDPQGCRIYRNSVDALKEIDTRSGDEGLWLNVEPTQGGDKGDAKKGFLRG